MSQKSGGAPSRIGMVPEPTPPVTMTARVGPGIEQAHGGDHRGQGWDRQGEGPRPAAHHAVRLFQLSARCCAVRQASAWAVSVGFLEPLVPITEPPTMPRLWTS